MARHRDDDDSVETLNISSDGADDADDELEEEEEEETEEEEESDPEVEARQRRRARGDDHAGDEEEEEAEIDPDDLTEIANEKDGKPRMVPAARLGKVTARLRATEDALHQAVAAAARTPAAAAPPKDAPPPFDLKGKIKERNKLILEGEEDAALAIDMEIEEHRQVVAEDRATERATKAARAEVEAERVQSVIAAAFERYPFLSDLNDDHDPEALEDVMMYRDRYLKKGDSLPVALEKAVRKVCPGYAEEEEEEEEDPTPRQARTARETLQRANLAKRIPPRVGTAGKGNRAKPPTSVDPADLTDKEFDALPEADKRRERGDFISEKRRARG